MLFNKPWNSSSLNQCLPWRAQLSQVGWLGTSSDMPCSPGCWNPPFHQSQGSPSPWKCGFEVTCASHGAKQGFMGVLMTCTGSCAPQSSILGQGCSWKTNRATPAWCWDTVRWAERTSGFVRHCSVTCGAVLNNPWGSLCLRQSCDFSWSAWAATGPGMGAALSQALPASSYKGIPNVYFDDFFF